MFGRRYARRTPHPQGRIGSDPPHRRPRDVYKRQRHHILKVLEYAAGNKAEAARLLGIGIATLYRKLESYGLKS